MNKVNYYHSYDKPNDLPDDYYGREFITICRKVRELALQNKIIVQEMDKIYSSDVDNFIKLIGSCGVGVKDFIKGYLSAIQPYSFEGFQKNISENGSLIWSIDIGYRVQLMIRLYEDSDCLIVSFHESVPIQIGGVNRLSRTSDEKNFSDKLCAVIVDMVLGWSGETGSKRYVHISFTLQRSFIRSTIEMLAQHINEGVALVKYSKLKELYQDKINIILNNLQETYFVGSVERSLSLRHFKVFFLGYRYSVANNVCLLLDCFDTYTDSISRSVVLEVTDDLLSKIPIESAPELRAVLEDRYGKIINYNSELYQQILLCCGEG